jgi:hypothetical protein
LRQLGGEAKEEEGEEVEDEEGGVAIISGVVSREEEAAMDCQTLICRGSSALTG